MFQPDRTWTIALDILAWPIIHLSVSWAAFRRPLKSFDENGWLYRPRGQESLGRVYRSRARISSWKHLLPDGAALFPGSFRKGKLDSRDPVYLRRYLQETCRGEWAHWVTLAFVPVFFLWNPLWADAVMLAYGLITNVPCILVQRHNRFALNRILKRLNPST